MVAPDALAPPAAAIAARAEVLVVGAGPAGAVAALLLARWGARVALVRAPSRETARAVVGEVLPPAARPAFARLGLAALLEDPAHRLVPGTVADWGPGPPSTTDHLRSPWGEGLQLDRAAFERCLVDAAVAAGTRVVDGSRTAWRRAATASGRARRAGPRVVLDATGRAAAVARAAGARVERADRLVALCGILQPGPEPSPGDRRVLVAAEEGGWWSSMVLPDGRRLAAFHTDPDMLPTGPGADASTWFAQLLTAPVIGPEVGQAGWCPPRAIRTVAADSRRLLERTPDGSGEEPTLLAAGDAEMAFDPLSSFGILGALSSAEEAVGVIRAILDGGGDGSAAARDAAGARAAAREARWTRYRERLRAVYAEETRWRDAPFWTRRTHGAGQRMGSMATVHGIVVDDARQRAPAAQAEAGRPSARRSMTRPGLR